jgi:regulator of replication initiation timing
VAASCRRAQQQLQDAEVRTMGTVQENVAVKFENLDLKRRLLELEGQLNLPPSFEADALQEQHVQLVQQAQQAQQVAWQVQQGYPQQQGQTEGGAPQQQGLSSPREPLWGRGLRQDGDSSSPSTAQQAAPEAAAAAAAAAGQ